LFKVDAMSLHILVSGTLVADPQKRLAKSGSEYITGQLRVLTGEEIVLVGFIAFTNDSIDPLLKLSAGDSCSVTGVAKMTHWTARDGGHASGLSVTVDRVLTIT
jgi:hypothetical protein